VSAADIPGRIKTTLRHALDLARMRTVAAELAADAGNGHGAASRLRSAARRLVSFAFRLRSHAGRKQITDADLRAALTAEAQGVIADIETLRNGF
jgi:hypothetical protein